MESVFISNTIRSSYVSEQAYRPCNGPLSLWVLREGANGSSLNSLKVFDRGSSRAGFFLISFAEVLRNCFFEKSRNNLFLEFSYGFHQFIYRLKFNIRLFSGLTKPFKKFLLFLVLLKEIANKISYLSNLFFRKMVYHFMYICIIESTHGKYIKEYDYNVNSRIEEGGFWKIGLTGSEWRG